MPTEPTCACCGHTRQAHFNGRGCCREWQQPEHGGGPCLCSRYLRLRWDKWQPAKVGTVPHAAVRFRVHNNPSKWSVFLNKPVEFQIKGDPTIHCGIVDKVNPVAFIALH